MILGTLWLITVGVGRRGHLDRGGLEMRLRSKGGESLMIEDGIGGRDFDSEAKETARFIFIRDVNIHEQEVTVGVVIAVFLAELTSRYSPGMIIVESIWSDPVS
jgi:hypothetical protein